MKRKIILLTLLFILVLLGFKLKKTFGQLDSSVPVTDYGTINSLGQIIDALNQANDVLGTTLATLSRELEKLNTNIENVLKNQFSKKTEEIVTDSLKEEFFFYKLINLESLIQRAEKKSSDETKVQEALEEARLAGFYNALNQIPYMFICLPSELNFELRSVASLVAFNNLEGDFIPETEIEKVFSQIPPCEEINENGITTYRNFKNAQLAKNQKRQNFFSRVMSALSSPFRLSQLAQTGDFDNFYNPNYDQLDFPGRDLFNQPPYNQNNQLDQTQDNEPQTNQNSAGQPQTNQNPNGQQTTNQNQINQQSSANQNNQNQIIPEFYLQPDYTRGSRYTAYQALKNNFQDYFQTSIDFEVNKREKQIKNGWPIENCEKYISLDGQDENDKKLICLNWKTGITYSDLKKARENLLDKEGSLLTLNAQNMNIFQKFLQMQNMLTKFNLSATSVSTSSDMAGNFPDATETKEIIDRTCEKFKGVEEDNPPAISRNQTSPSSPESTSTAYVMCLESMSTGMQKMADILKKQFEQAIKISQEHDKKLEEALREASTTASNAEQCKGLDGIKREINALKNELINQRIYLANNIFNNILTDWIQDINPKIIQIKKDLVTIRKELEIISSQKTTAEILSTIFPNFASTIRDINNIINILNNLGLNINLKIKDFNITGQNKWVEITNQIKNKKLQEIIKIITTFESQIDKIISINQKILNYRLSLQKQGITEFAKREDVNETIEIIKKINNYKEIIRNCQKIDSSLTETTQIQILNSKKVVYIKKTKNEIVYKNKWKNNFISNKDRYQKTHLLANIKNLFKPKKIEISLTNEK